jgi:hypothetical protein
VIGVRRRPVAAPAHDLPSLPRNPTVYGIDVLPWLFELRQFRGPEVTLGTIGEAKWDEIAELGVDAVWLRGVWARSAEGARIALRTAELVARFRETIRDFKACDVVGSSASIRAYEVDPRLGTRTDLARARAAMARRGIRLILDFVPNHVAPDHPWVTTHPSCFIQGDAADLRDGPAEFLRCDGRILARGRDPYAPPWPDVVQLNAFDAGHRALAAAAVRDIASQCDGIRCDRAALVLNEVFARTWGARAGPIPATEYWSAVIEPVKTSRPDFLFLADSDWDREWDLQQLGFDYTYDRRLRDRLVHDAPDSVRAHLKAEPGYQRRLARFLEEDGGSPVATAFGLARHRAVAVAAATQVGARIFHEGQCAGRRRKPCDFLVRRPADDGDRAVAAFYRLLLAALRREPLRDGEWQLCEITGWPGNPTSASLGAWRWRGRDGWALVVVNLSGCGAQARVRLQEHDLAGRRWILGDLLSGARYERDGTELCEAGLYVDLPPWGCHLLLTDPR